MMREDLWAKIEERAALERLRRGDALVTFANGRSMLVPAASISFDAPSFCEFRSLVLKEIADVFGGTRTR